VTEIAARGSAARLRAFREFGEVRKAILPSSIPARTGPCATVTGQDGGQVRVVGRRDQGTDVGGQVHHWSARSS
jgi:hypothetical protein